MKTITTIIAALMLSLTISAQNTITTDSILQLSTCAGGNVLVPFTATGTYSLGNNFIAQLSNNFGQFTTPVNIGQTSLNIGFILATIPQNTNFGFLYKIRVISTNPAITGTPCPNTLIITQISQLNQIIAAPNDTICQGDTATLTALNVGASYQWSTGDTTQSITVTQSGVYTVTTTDIATCQSDASITIVVIPCTSGIGENNLSNSFIVYPNPTSSHTTLHSDYLFKNATLTVYNLYGQTVKEIKNISGKTVTLYRDNLPSGLYFIHLQQDNKIITSDKLVITD